MPVQTFHTFLLTFNGVGNWWTRDRPSPTPHSPRAVFPLTSTSTQKEAEENAVQPRPFLCTPAAEREKLRTTSTVAATTALLLLLQKARQSIHSITRTRLAQPVISTRRGGTALPRRRHLAASRAWRLCLG